ncbi:unnamed protein product [marine sediment metagenome]|uniref:Uncharacterized protein n=1 Tax=marine sediment metagenome TaxID=412755 RepID=X1GL86_9ZZZZ
MQSDAKRQLGSQGEDIVKRWLLGQGYSILPASLIQTGGAPMLLERSYKAILPDNLTWKDRHQRWIEVKTKSNPTTHESWPNRKEHGLPLRHWAAYEFVQQQTQTPVTLAILELSSGTLLTATLDELKATARIYPMKGEYHIFLARDAFQEHPLEKMTLPEQIPPRAARTIEQQQQQRPRLIREVNRE